LTEDWFIDHDISKELKNLNGVRSKRLENEAYMKAKYAADVQAKAIDEDSDSDDTDLELLLPTYKDLYDMLKA